MLRELQLDLARAFAAEPDPDAVRRVEASLRPMPALSPARGVEIYRSALLHTLGDALAEIYPVCAELVGPDCFLGIARSYARIHVSEHPDLGHVGDALPALLPELPFLDAVPYLADVARLELALHEAAEAPDPERALDPERIGVAIADEPHAWRFRLPPSATLVESSHPVRAIWEAHQRPAGEPVSWDASQPSGPDRSIVWRGPGGLRVDAVEPRLWPLLSAIDAGLPVASLPGLDAEPEPVLAEISRLFERGWIAGVAPVDAD